MIHWLAVSSHLKKYEFVNWDVEILNIWENKTCSSHHQPVHHDSYNIHPTVAQFFLALKLWTALKH